MRCTRDAGGQDAEREAIPNGIQVTHLPTHFVKRYTTFDFTSLVHTIFHPCMIGTHVDFHGRRLANVNPDKMRIPHIVSGVNG